MWLEGGGLGECPFVLLPKTYSCLTLLFLLPLVARPDPFYRVPHHRHSERVHFSRLLAPTYLAWHGVNN